MTAETQADDRLEYDGAEYWIAAICGVILIAGAFVLNARHDAAGRRATAGVEAARAIDAPFSSGVDSPSAGPPAGREGP